MPDISGQLVVEIAVNGGTSYVLDLDGERLEFHDRERDSFALQAKTQVDWSSLLPVELRSKLREWRSQRVGARWFGLRVCDELWALPWTAALQVELSDDPIAWVIPGLPAQRFEPLVMEDVKLLVAGWDEPILKGGIQREIEDLAVLNERGLRMSVALGPSVDNLRFRLQNERPSIVHLALLNSARDTATLSYRDTISGEPQTLNASVLATLLPPETRLIVFNTCYTTPTALQIASTRGVITLGWNDVVTDDRARSFAVFLYEQLLRGTSLWEAVLVFAGQHAGSDAEHRDFTGQPGNDGLPNMHSPVAVVREFAELDLKFSTARPGADSTRGTPASNHRSTAERVLTPLVIETRDAINPAMLINGRAPLRTVRITSQHAVPRATIEVTCDAGIGLSKTRRMLDLVAGVTSANVDDFQFPILYELLRLGIKRRPINFHIRLLADSSVIAEETKSSWWMAKDEWIDSRETYEYLPAFIDPECDTIKELWANVDRRAIRDLDGENASLRLGADIYVSAIYQAIRALRIQYIRPPSSPLGIHGKRISGQRVRSPAEIVADRRGTCHDLALLFAACMEHILLYPVVVLVPGHTFVGYWQNSKSHAQYWGNKKLWQISHKQELAELADNRDITLLEATRVTDPHEVTFVEACNLGRASLAQASTLDAAIDVRASRAFINSLQ